MSTPYHHRRNQKRGAALIILLSVIVMLFFMVLFFSIAMKTSASQKVPDDTLPPTDTTQDISPETDETTAMRQEEETTKKTTDSTAQTEPLPKPIQTEPVTEKATEKVTEKTPVQTEPPVLKPSDTPDSVPVISNAELFDKVALGAGTMPDGYVDRLVFYGDSTTYGMKAYKVFGSRDTKQVWTPKSGTLALFRAATDLVYDPNTDTELSLNDICAQNKPEYLIVTLGVNGVSFMDEAYFKSEYQKVIDIIRTASPDTKLILQSIYPIARSYAKQSSINNTKIQAANEWIATLAYENSLPYLNTYFALVGEDGYLPESYQNGDGMHFNEVGFAAVMDYIKTHPYL